MSIDDEVNRIPGLDPETREAWTAQLTPPDGLPPEVYEQVARAQGERWGYAQTLEGGFGRWVRDRTDDVNVRADVHTVWRLAVEHFGKA